VSILFYASKTTDRKSHKAIYHTELLSAYALIFKYLFVFLRSRDIIAIYLFKFLHHVEMSLGIDVLDPLWPFLNPLNPELNPICYLLALLGAHHFLHVSRIRVKSLTFRRLVSYIYMEHPFLMFLDHTQRRSTVGRTPLDE